MRPLVYCLCAGLLMAQGPPSFTPSQADLAELRAKLDTLDAQLRELPESDLKPDVEVYARAVRWILRFPEEFYTADFVNNAMAAADAGMHRVSQLKSGKADWPGKKGYVVRAYRSRVDGSIQPYGLLIPESYSGAAPVRLDVWLKGRGATMNEVSFIAQHDPDFPRARPLAPLPSEQDYIQLDVFGRTNNAYRWAGETDVFEALDSVIKRYKIDPTRIVLRGFSMGGAGAWHIGLHHPSRWAAVEAGAGFNETVRYAKQSSLAAGQEKLLTIYDAYRYALNAFNVPFVGYGGEKDPQLQASVNVREQLVAEGFDVAQGPLKVLFLVGPATEHRWHPGKKKESEAFIRSVLPRQDPDHVRFVTYTLRYPQSHWIKVEGLERHYERAEVDARPGTIRTRNVSRLAVNRAAAEWEIDGQRIGRAPANPAFEKHDGKWRIARGDQKGKRPGLQGPIDDAFMDSFLCVRPTGSPMNTEAHRYAIERLDRFAREYAKWLRGDAPVRDDSAVTDEDIRNSNLILFGDPGSNRLIKRILGRLPLEWKSGKLKLGGGEFSSSSHLPVLIYPNPLNPDKYIVLNSGHTFGERDFRGTNALLYPRIGDWAVIRISDGETAASGLFDEHWR